MITLFSHKGGPNGWKVATVLELLELKYETKFLEFSEMKTPDYEKFNPNGRIPAIIDHDNDDFVIWESNAIIAYLADRYDKDRKYSYPHGTKEAYLIDQWMTFQASGQGPYFGQLSYFCGYHPEKIPSAIERYRKEAMRVTSVLDGVLASRPYLLGDKLTIADLTFIPWNVRLPVRINGSPFEEELAGYKNTLKWHEGLLELPAVKKVMAAWKQASPE